MFGLFHLIFPRPTLVLIIALRFVRSFLSFRLSTWLSLKLGLASLIATIQSLLELFALLLIVLLFAFHLLELVHVMRQFTFNRVYTLEDLLSSKVHIAAYNVALALKGGYLIECVQICHLLLYVTTCSFEDCKQLLKFGLFLSRCNLRNWNGCCLKDSWLCWLLVLTTILRNRPLQR